MPIYTGGFNMFNRKFYLKACNATLLSIALAPSVFAEVPGFTAGVDYGRTEAKKFCDNITNCDSEDNGPKVEVGYTFNKNWGTEVGYTSFGTLFDSQDSAFSVKQDGYAITLTVLGEIPFNEMFSIYGRAGVAWYQTNSSGQVAGVNVSDRNGTTPVWGAGAKWTFNEMVALRVEYQNYMDISRVDGNKDDVQGLFGGLVFQF
jgi:opacity protein-like surface antigen